MEYGFMQPFHVFRRLHDTCGVLSLHGIPGIFSGLLSVLMSTLASREV